MIERVLTATIIRYLLPGKVIILRGPRRVGKTVLAEFIASQSQGVLLFNGEDIATHELLERRSAQHYKQIIGHHKMLIIDEAQKVTRIGEVLKLIVDNLPHLKILISGSSAFDLHSRTGEPLTGRSYTFTLYPLAEEELYRSERPSDRKDNLMARLIFGSYPELIQLPAREQKEKYLRELLNTYLLRDILALENIRNSSKILNLLRLISYQVGSEVSYNELGSSLGMSKNTVEKYLDLLQKVFILHKIEAFSKNMRKEIVKSSRWYFLDNGIRNAVIANFNWLDTRDDVGKLWENYIIAERLKFQEYHGIHANNFFWRTYDRQEVDWVEERDGKMFGYEFKWGNKKTKVPPAWKKNYPQAEFNVIHQDNYREWIG
ncbi:MAG: ATP-binding protein [Cyclobacteriaceae bacterium]